MKAKTQYRPTAEEIKKLNTTVADGEGCLWPPTKVPFLAMGVHERHVNGRWSATRSYVKIIRIKRGVGVYYVGADGEEWTADELYPNSMMAERIMCLLKDRRDWQECAEELREKERLAPKTPESVELIKKSNEAYQEQVKNLTALVEHLWVHKVIACLKAISYVSPVQPDYHHITEKMARAALKDLPPTLSPDWETK